MKKLVGAGPRACPGSVPSTLGWANRAGTGTCPYDYIHSGNEGGHRRSGRGVWRAVGALQHCPVYYFARLAACDVVAWAERTVPVAIDDAPVEGRFYVVIEGVGWG